jgi:renalase
VDHSESSRGLLDAVVVGAGMAGLFAARTLADAGRSVTVLDQDSSLGGRMSTQRFGDGAFDHGAQYFTARDPVFRTWVEQWLTMGLIHLWSDGFATASGKLNQNGEPRYIGSRGMGAIPSHLADGLRVTLAANVTACAWTGKAWEIRYQEGASGHRALQAKSVVLTPPVPQSLSLLAAGGVTLDATTQSALGRIDYSRCLVALVELEGNSLVPAPGGLWLSGEPVSWVADNQQKGISPKTGGARLTIHAGKNFSLEHWDADPDTTARQLADAVQRWLGSPVRTIRFHRWRYAAPITVYPERCLALNEPGRLVFAGDAFAGPRVEGAVLSGLAAGEAVLKGS